MACLSNSNIDMLIEISLFVKKAWTLKTKTLDFNSFIVYDETNDHKSITDPTHTKLYYNTSTKMNHRK